MIGMHVTNGKELEGVEHLRQSIADILTTPLGSRVMRRDYGSLAFELIDRAANATGEMLLKAVCADALAKWEPRLRLKRITLSGVTFDGRTLIDIEGEYLEGGARVTLTDIPLAVSVGAVIA